MRIHVHIDDIVYFSIRYLTNSCHLSQKLFKSCKNEVVPKVQKCESESALLLPVLQYSKYNFLDIHKLIVSFDWWSIHDFTYLSNIRWIHNIVFVVTVDGVSCSRWLFISNIPGVHDCTCLTTPGLPPLRSPPPGQWLHQAGASPTEI